MEQRVSIITLGVAELERAKAFYDALGWRAANEAAGEGIVAYDLIGMTLTLYPWAKLAEDAGISAERAGPSAMALAYNAPDRAGVEAVLEAAAAAGGRLVKPAAESFWGGYSGYFADPDGHLWEVAMNPHAPLGPGGAFQWNGAA